MAKHLTLVPPQPPTPNNSDTKKQSKKYSQQTTVFNHILSKEECLFNEELDRYLSDLDIFIGGPQVCDYPRDLSDIIFITDTYSRVQGKHVRNVIPISTFNGTKKDFTLVAL